MSRGGFVYYIYPTPHDYIFNFLSVRSKDVTALWLHQERISSLNDFQGFGLWKLRLKLLQFQSWRVLRSENYMRILNFFFTNAWSCQVMVFLLCFDHPTYGEDNCEMSSIHRYLMASLTPLRLLVEARHRPNPMLNAPSQTAHGNCTKVRLK